MNKVLLIRFSSFGDVTQCLSVPTSLQGLGEDTEIHWATRLDMAPLLTNHPHIDKIWTLDKQSGAKGLWQLAKQLRKENFTDVYDAHNNLRSFVLSSVIRFLRPVRFLRKSQRRWKRFLLFRFRLNTFEQPFSGQRDLLEPLKKWNLPIELPPTPQIHLTKTIIEDMQKKLAHLGVQKFIALAPSAAYPLKRWPLTYWKELIRQNPKEKYVTLGGPGDNFIQELRQEFQGQVINLAGKTDLQQSAAVVQLSQLLISNDTGILHLGEQLGKPVIALMGPAPFGFPSRPTTRILQRDLPCRPCSKHGQGPCRNEKFQRCLTDILPAEVSQEMRKLL
jgi:ADP-heptose:LPS heptosyltransferase